MTDPIRLESVETDKYSLEVGECDCGYHFGIDATFLDQVQDFKFHCPSCKRVIDTTKLFSEDEEDIHIPQSIKNMSAVAGPIIEAGTKALDKLATGNLAAQHRAAVVNTKLRKALRDCRPFFDDNYMVGVIDKALETDPIEWPEELLRVFSRGVKDGLDGDIVRYLQGGKLISGMIYEDPLLSTAYDNGANLGEEIFKSHCGVYYSEEHDNYYCASCLRGMGEAYYLKHHKRKQSSPSLKEKGLSLGTVGWFVNGKAYCVSCLTEPPPKSGIPIEKGNPDHPKMKRVLLTSLYEKSTGNKILCETCGKEI